MDSTTQAKTPENSNNVERRAERISTRRLKQVDDWFENVMKGLRQGCSQEDTEMALKSLNVLTQMASIGTLAKEFAFCVQETVPGELL